MIGREALTAPRTPAVARSPAQGKGGVAATLQRYIDVMELSRTNTSLVARARLRNKLPLYAASGMLTYGDTEGESSRAPPRGARARVRAARRPPAQPSWRPTGSRSLLHLPPGFENVQKQLLDAGVAPRVVYKEAVLDAAELQGRARRAPPCPAPPPPHTHARRWLSGVLLGGATVCTGLHSEQLALLDMTVMSRAALFFGYTRSSMSFLIAQLRHARGMEDTTHWVSSDAPPHLPADTIARHAEFAYAETV